MVFRFPVTSRPQLPLNVFRRMTECEPLMVIRQEDDVRESLSKGLSLMTKSLKSPPEVTVTPAPSPLKEKLLFLTVSARDNAGLPVMAIPPPPLNQIMAPFHNTCAHVLEHDGTATTRPKVDVNQPYVGNAARHADASGDARTAVAIYAVKTISENRHIADPDLDHRSVAVLGRVGTVRRNWCSSRTPPAG